MGGGNGGAPPVCSILSTGSAVDRSSSFLVGYPPLPGGQHVVERIPADARPGEEDRKEQIKGKSLQNRGHEDEDVSRNASCLHKYLYF